MPQPSARFRLRLSSGAVANAVAWALLGALIVVAIWVTDRLGFAGLVLLGGLTWLVCTRASLGHTVPTASVGVFRAALHRPRSMEDKAAAAMEREDAIAPLRFYGRCGALLALIGAAGFAWQLWTGGPAPG